MVVTEIKEFTKDRLIIKLDEEFAFVLYKGELHTYGIKLNEEIAEENYLKITEEVLPKRAKLRAMNLLTKRTYTSYQLAQKLKTGGYSEQIIAEAIAYVASFGYINDEQYAVDYIEYNMNRKNRMRIFTDLQQKGISKDLCKSVWEQVAGDNTAELEKEQISQWLRKKNYSVETADYSEKQKMMASLYRKGFSMDVIRSVLSLDITPI